MSYQTIENAADFSFGENTVLINSIDEYCNVTAVNNVPVVTHNSMDKVEPGKDCALYCAHKDCGSAMHFYNENEMAMHGTCQTISYLKFGARKMLLDDRFSFKDRETCRSAVN